MMQGTDDAMGLTWPPVSRTRVNLQAFSAIACCFILVLAVFWPGLSGGFLLDDFENFESLRRYLAGDVSWSSVVWGNASGPLGRPLSMLTFLADATRSGMDPAAFLFTNLVLHLGCGVLLALLIVRLLGVDPQFAGRNAVLVGCAIALLWSLLPLHVSVVLYAVQRMAILSAFFVFAALLVYVVGRERLSLGQKGWFGLMFVCFPLLTACAVLAKENGAVAPLMAGVIELAWYRRSRGALEARWRATFFVAFVLLPAIGVLSLLVANPAALLGGYEIRSFSLVERLLTQPRVLWEYVRHIVLPFGPAMGLIHDDFPKSTGLLQPITTLLAIAAWALAFVLAWRVRRTAPALLGGLGLFIAAHAVESTFLPLELYFEHRNYLAAPGILLACAAVGGLISARVAAPSAAFRRTLVAAAFALPLVFAVATFARASLWGDPPARMQQALDHSPSSPRLRSQLAVAAAEKGDLAGALAHIDAVAAGPASPPRRTLDLWRILSACLANQALGGDTLVAAIAAAELPRITLTEMVSFEALAKRVEDAACQWPSAGQAIMIGHAMLAQSRQSPSTHEVWRVRYFTARLIASTGDLDSAVALAEQSWADSAWNAGVGILVFQLHASRGDVVACRRTLEQLKVTVGDGDHRGQEAIARFESHVIDAESRIGATPQTEVESAQPGETTATPSVSPYAR